MVKTLVGMVYRSWKVAIVRLAIFAWPIALISSVVKYMEER